MATRKSSIGAELVIDRRKFKAALDESRADAARFASGLASIKAPRTGPLSPEGASSMKQAVSGVIGKYQHLRGVVTDVAGLAIRSAGAPAMYADMTDSLTAVTGSAEEARAALDFLGAVSEEQKLEFEPLVEAYEHMRGLGYQAQETRDFIRELANAIETSGKDSGDLAAIVGSLTKVKDKAELSVRALGKMGESVPFLRTIFKEQFGSEAAADIEKLGLTTGDLFDGLMRGLRRVETNKGGILDAASPEYMASAARLRGGRSGNLTNPLLPDLPERIPQPADAAGDASRLAFFKERAAAAAAAEDAEKKRKSRQAALATMRQEQSIAEAEFELEKARLSKDAELIAKREQELLLVKEIRETVEKTGLSEKKVTDMLTERAGWLKDIAKLQAEAEQGKFLGDAKEQMEIDRLRSRGKNKQADKLEAARTVKNRKEQLMKEGGMNAEDAEKMAQSEQRIQKDADYLAKHGRVKMRGAISENSLGGLADRPADGTHMSMRGGWDFPALRARREDLEKRPVQSSLATGAGNRGMSEQQASEMIEVLRVIRNTAVGFRQPVSQKTKPR